MKKLWWITIASIVMISISLTPQASAAKTYGIVKQDVNRTFVPVRYAAEALGFKVNWIRAENKVIIGEENQKVELTVDSISAKVNGQVKKIDASPFKLAGSVYVPVRFVAEALGAKVTSSKDGTVSFQLGKKTTQLETIPLQRIQKAIEQPAAVTTTKVSVSSKTFNITQVTLDLYHPTIKLDAVYANNKIGTAEPLNKMAERSKATVAINGTFFDAYTDDHNKKIPYGYIIKDGSVINKASGNKRATFVYTTDGHALIVDGENELNAYIQDQTALTALQVGPRLLRKGKIDTDPVSEGFQDPKILTNSGARSAIGITRDGKLLFITTSGVTIPQLAEIMLKLGAYEAMNLDGGASSGLYAHGKYITPPGRDLSNALIIKF